MLKIRRLRDRLIFNMGVPIHRKTIFILRRGPAPCSYQCCKVNIIVVDDIVSHVIEVVCLEYFGFSKRRTEHKLVCSGKTPYCKISWGLEAARFGFRFFQLLWNLTGTCKTSKRYNHYNIQSRGFETARDLAIRRLTAWWIDAYCISRHTYCDCYCTLLFVLVNKTECISELNV